MDQGYAAWATHEHGAVHFEARLASLMVPNYAEAEVRLQRAVAAKRAQPMAWNSLAILRLSRHQIDRATEAIEAGLAAMPGDAVTERTASMLRKLKGKPSPAETDELILLMERFPGHAQLASEAAAFLRRVPAGTGLDIAAAIANLEKAGGRAESERVAQA